MPLIIAFFKCSKNNLSYIDIRDLYVCVCVIFIEYITFRLAISSFGTDVGC